MTDEKNTSDTSSPSGADDDEKTIVFRPQPAAPAVTAAPEAEAAQDDEDRTIVVRDTERTGAPAKAPPAPVEISVPPVTDTRTASVISPAPGHPVAPITSLEPGMVINNMYRVEESLDQGGMGRVFRGEEIGTGESVAIKVILPEMAEDTKVADMFRREARVLRQLHHDAIVRYFAYVPPDENLSFHALVMGFIQGTKLSDTLKLNGALNHSDVIKLTMRLADGLERAHSIGVVHRDLSPDNVMLQDGDIGKAVLIDFGISRSSTVKDVTIGNEFAGKLKYVSPEQLGSFGGQAEGPSDVYSLGLLMIAMLMGKPYNMGGNFAEAVQLRMSVPDISMVAEEFQPLLTEMLQPDPKLRLPGMTAVKEELRAMSEGEPSTTRSRLTMSGFSAPDISVPGLQAVPFASTSTGGQTSAPRSMPPTSSPPPEKSGGRGLLVTMLVAGLAVAGGAAVYLNSDILTDGTRQGDAPASDDPVAAGLERVAGSRAAFLAETVPENCTYATRRAHGDTAGLIEGFALNLSQLQGIGDAFGAAFGSAPAVVGRNVTDAQCAVLDFARSLQGTRGAGVELSLASSTFARGDGVQGSLFGSAGRQNWLALVDPNGQVFSLMRQFDAPIGDQRRFAFRLPSAAPGIYMLIATASDSPLVRAGAMRDGTQAADILPLMTRELATDGQGATDVAFLELTR